MADVREQLGIRPLAGGETTGQAKKPPVEKLSIGGLKKGDEVVFVTLEGTYGPGTITKVHSPECVDVLPTGRINGVEYSEADGLMYSPPPGRRRSWHLKEESNAASSK